MEDTRWSTLGKIKIGYVYLGLRFDANSIIKNIPAIIPPPVPISIGKFRAIS